MINTCIRRGFFILTGLYSGGLIEVRQAGVGLGEMAVMVRD